MSGLSAPRWPTWLDIAIQIVEKFRKPDNRTRTVNTRTRIHPTAYSDRLGPIERKSVDAKPFRLVERESATRRGADR